MMLNKNFLLPVYFFGIGITLYLAYILNPILLALFVAFIIYSGVKPAVDWLEEKKVKRWIGIVISYLSILTITSFLFIFIINSLASQIVGIVNDISENFETRTNQIQSFVDQNTPFLSGFVSENLEKIRDINSDGNIENTSSSDLFNSFSSNIGAIGTQGFRFFSGVVGGLFTIFTVFFISIYMVIPRKPFYKNLTKLLAKDYKKLLNNIFEKSSIGLGAWLRGLFVLMLFIGIATFFIIIIPDIFIDNYALGRFALLLAIIAGLLEALPNIGPILTFAITIILAILLGTPLVVIIYLTIAMLILQQLEAIFLVPVVMKKALDINPIISIVGLIAGFELSGSVIGALMALPIIGVAQIIFTETIAFYQAKKVPTS